MSILTAVSLVSTLSFICVCLWLSIVRTDKLEDRCATLENRLSVIEDKLEGGE